VHRITIITAFLGALAYLVWEINDVLTTGTAVAVARCVAAAAFVVALGLYLRNLRARLDAKLRPIEPPPADRHDEGAFREGLQNSPIPDVRRVFACSVTRSGRPSSLTRSAGSRAATATPSSPSPPIRCSAQARRLRGHRDLAALIRTLDRSAMESRKEVA